MWNLSVFIKSVVVKSAKASDMHSKSRNYCQTSWSCNSPGRKTNQLEMVHNSNWTSDCIAVQFFASHFLEISRNLRIYLCGNLFFKFLTASLIVGNFSRYQSSFSKCYEHRLGRHLEFLGHLVSSEKTMSLWLSPLCRFIGKLEVSSTNGVNICLSKSTCEDHHHILVLSQNIS